MDGELVAIQTVGIQSGKSGCPETSDIGGFHPFRTPLGRQSTIRRNLHPGTRILGGSSIPFGDHWCWLGFVPASVMPAAARGQGVLHDMGRIRGKPIASQQRTNNYAINQYVQNRKSRSTEEKNKRMSTVSASRCCYPLGGQNKRLLHRLSALTRTV